MMYAMNEYLLHGDMGYIMEEASWWLCHKLSDLVALPHISVLVALPQYLYLVTSSQYLAASLRFLWCVAVGWVE